MQALKRLVPLFIRTRLKWLGYWIQDMRDPITAPRVPARRHTFIGGGDFEQGGVAFLRIMKRHKLKAKHNVLDVGCGQGRMARVLVEFLGPKGRYTGFDIVQRGIAWCQAEYDDLDAFEFIHADVYNERYNPKGQTLAKDYVFPFEDNTFNFTFLTSVFTHMFTADVEQYVSEIARTLKPGGRALITWFLLDDVSQNVPDPKLDFKYDIDAVSKTTVKQNPEAAIAYRLDYVRDLIDRHGLEVVKIEFGTWARPESRHSLQDLTVLRKTPL